MKTFQLAQSLEQLEHTASRLEITAILSQIFKDLSIEEIRPACYLLQGQILPQYHGLEFQVSSKTILKVLAKLLPSAGQYDEGELSLFGNNLEETSTSFVEQKYKQVGDLGKVAEEVIQESLRKSAVTRATEELTVTELYAAL